MAFGMARQCNSGSARQMVLDMAELYAGGDISTSADYTPGVVPGGPGCTVSVGGSVTTTGTGSPGVVMGNYSAGPRRKPVVGPLPPRSVPYPHDRLSVAGTIDAKRSAAIVEGDYHESEEKTPPRVFISYARDSDKHAERVENLATSLRNNGIDSRLDQWCQTGIAELGVGPWIELQIREADFVVVVCSPAYKKNSEVDEQR